MIDFQNVSFSYGEESSGGGIRNVTKRNNQVKISFSK